MTNMLRKLYQTAVKAIDELTFETTITTGAVDRDGQIVRPEGLRLTNYMRNPVVMYGHDYTQLPVAKALSVHPDGETLVSRFQFPPEGTYEFADTVRRMWAGGFLNATSIGFIPLHAINADGDEAGDMLGRTAGITIDEGELLEFSIVPVPSNQEALRRALKAVDVGLKPYPSEHACRLRPPEDFEKDSFARDERDHEGKPYSVIMGKLAGEDTMTEQAYRYPKDEWEADAAQAHCEAADGTFEAASQEAKAIAKEGRVVSGKDHAMITEIVASLRKGAKDLQAYLDTNAPAPKGVTIAQVIVPDAANTSVSLTPEALKALGEFAKSLQEMNR